MRNIDPATLHDEWYVAQTLPVRLFWISLLLTVDDQGRFTANPALVRSQVFPADDISLAEVEALLQAMDGKVLFYEVKGNRYGQIVNWWKYQGHAIWMGRSRLPPPEGWSDRYRYHVKGNKLVQSSNWRDTPEPGPDETVESEPQEGDSGAAGPATAEIPAELDSPPGTQLGSGLGSQLGSQLGSELHSALGSSGGRSDGDGDGDTDDEGESEGDVDVDAEPDQARASPRAVTPPLARAQIGDQNPGTPAPPGSATERAAQAILLQASGLAALPPSEVPRVEQVGAMITAYGEEKTLAELRAQREKWCRTRGRNGSYYSPLNMGWVDRADEALSGHGPPPAPREVRLPPPPAVYPDTVPIPEHLRRPSKAERDADRQRAAALSRDETHGATGPPEGSVTD